MKILKKTYVVGAQYTPQYMPVYICYINCLSVTYRPIGSGVQMFVSLSQLLYT